MGSSKFIEIVKSQAFRITTMIVGLIFTFASLFIHINPESFLKTGYSGVFVFSFFSSGMFLLPTVIGNMNLIAFTIISSLAMTINESISWYIGHVGTDVLPHGEKTKRIVKNVEKYGVFGVFFFALIPFPFDTIGIVAGYLDMPYLRFIITVFIARVLRLVIISTGIIWTGISSLL